MQAIRVALTAGFLGLFGVAGLFANYGAPPSASADLEKTENQPNMPNSASTLLTRNLNEKTIRCAGAKPSTNYSLKTPYFTIPKAEFIVAATRSTASRANSG